MPPEDSHANGGTRALSEALRCAGCGRAPRPDENPLDDWRAYSTGIELLLFCPQCADREFPALSRYRAALAGRGGHCGTPASFSATISPSSRSLPADPRVRAAASSCSNRDDSGRAVHPRSTPSPAQVQNARSTRLTSTVSSTETTRETIRASSRRRERAHRRGFEGATWLRPHHFSSSFLLGGAPCGASRADLCRQSPGRDAKRRTMRAANR
jgi:hypothetical protein